jgi:hypothetical protein
MVNSLLVIAILAVTGLFTYVVYEFFIKDIFLRRKGQLIRVFLYEKAGKEIVYINQRVCQDKKDAKLGNYLYIRKEKMPLERINNSDFVQDKKYGKALHVIRYGQDDYRPLIRVKDGEWYRREKRQVTEIEKVPDPDNPDQIMTIEKPKFDDNGEPVTNWFNVEYKEPLGITKDDRAAMRFNLSYHKRMDEIYGEKKNWLERFAPFMALGVVAIVLLMGFVHFTNQDTERAKLFYETVDIEAAKAYEKLENPSFIEGLVKKVGDDKKADEAPPR